MLKGDEDMIESLYTCLELFHRLDGPQMPKPQFDEDFIRLFHREDRASVRLWIKTNKKKETAK